ncbi:MAG: hypothetical protein ACI8SR_000926 [Oceanicoccus sp.]|jgi:hypothetical protein
MKLFLAIGILLGVAGCHSASKLETLDLAVPQQVSQLFFEIQGTAPHGVVIPVFKDTVISFGELKVTHWPVLALPCDPCEVSAGREPHPDGPTQWLVIKGSRNSTLLISSYQRHDYIKPWYVTYKQNHLLLEDRDSGLISNISYSGVFPKPIVGSNCQLTWLKREAQRQPASHISDDVADFKTQLIFQCKH